jgi:hypothetical protein
MSSTVLVEHFSIGLHFLVRFLTVVQSVMWEKPAGLSHGKVTCFVLRHSKLHRVAEIPRSLQFQEQVTSASLG